MRHQQGALAVICPALRNIAEDQLHHSHLIDYK
jgi:hypothetical protein